MINRDSVLIYMSNRSLMANFLVKHFTHARERQDIVAESLPK
jgi:hypothetical protein